MNKKDLEHFRLRLEEEKALLEEELGTISREGSNKSDHREATTADIEVDGADDNEVADKFEELEENKMILNRLEPQLNEVKSSLIRINDDKYGICEICNQSIEKERLEASATARTCKKHMK
jgi:DnaK suppressor protein